MTASECNERRDAILWCVDRGVITTMEGNAQLRELTQEFQRQVTIPEVTDG